MWSDTTDYDDPDDAPVASGSPSRTSAHEDDDDDSLQQPTRATSQLIHIYNNQVRPITWRGVTFNISIATLAAISTLIFVEPTLELAEDNGYGPFMKYATVTGTVGANFLLNHYFLLYTIKKLMLQARSEVKSLVGSHHYQGWTATKNTSTVTLALLSAVPFAMLSMDSFLPDNTNGIMFIIQAIVYTCLDFFSTEFMYDGGKKGIDYCKDSTISDKEDLANKLITQLTARTTRLELLFTTGQTNPLSADITAYLQQAREQYEIWQRNITKITQAAYDPDNLDQIPMLTAVQEIVEAKQHQHQIHQQILMLIAQSGELAPEAPYQPSTQLEKGALFSLRCLRYGTAIFSGATALGYYEATIAGLEETGFSSIMATLLASGLMTIFVPLLMRVTLIIIDGFTDRLQTLYKYRDEIQCSRNFLQYLLPLGMLSSLKTAIPTGLLLLLLGSFSWGTSVHLQEKAIDNTFLVAATALFTVLFNVFPVREVTNRFCAVLNAYFDPTSDITQQLLLLTTLTEWIAQLQLAGPTATIASVGESLGEALLGPAVPRGTRLLSDESEEKSGYQPPTTSAARVSDAEQHIRQELYRTTDAQLNAAEEIQPAGCWQRCLARLGLWRTPTTEESTIPLTNTNDSSAADPAAYATMTQ